VTALDAVQDRLIAFKAARVIAVDGRPLDIIGNGQIGAPVLVSNAIGATQANGVVRLPSGLAFPSNEGISLLTPGLQVQPIGRAVKYHVDANEVRGAVLVPEHSMAVWFTDGDAIAYCYSFDFWSTFTRHEASPGGCVAANGTYYWMDTSGGTVMVYDASRWNDAVGGSSEDVSMLIESGHLGEPSGIGWSLLDAVHLLGYLRSPNARVEVAFQYDREAAWQPVDCVMSAGALQATSWVDFLGDGLAPVATYTDQGMILEAPVARRRASSYRVQIRDASDTAIGEGVALTALVLQLGVQRGPMRRGGGRVMGTS